ncbi:unnamed protein product [Tuber aestivum]|uniref:AB hydrolase-1 domain-containing protein n=1 Tax=Tuber aestivum TaxID=59557 RepID=A0A292PYY7_9PEZI|nr:unnamed protein product [Tuber aestivum]
MIPKTSLPRFTRSAVYLRTYSTKMGPVPLAYHLHPAPIPSAAKNDSPLIVMHGLFGSRQNNHSISKALAKDLNRPVYTLDLRNHGESPHTPYHNYEVMAEDVEHFLQENKLGPKTVLIGHSMSPPPPQLHFNSTLTPTRGAKTAMAVALRKPSIISSIIAVDNAPIEAALHSSFGGYVRAMRKIEHSNLTNTKEADAILAEVEPDVAIRQFLLRNLVRSDSGRLGFRIPVGTLARELDNMSAFAYHPDEVRFEKRALFVRGTQSPYVPDEAVPIIGRFFPLFRLKDIDAGHWVISEKPNEFKEAVIEFLNEEE